MPDAPTMTGLRASYRVGETLNVTCTAHDSRPPARLTFLMNREQLTVSFPLTLSCCFPSLFPSLSYLFLTLLFPITLPFTLTSSLILPSTSLPLPSFSPLLSLPLTF